MRNEAIYEISNRAGVSIKWNSSLGRWEVILPSGHRIFTDLVACGDTVVLNGADMSVFTSKERIEPKDVPGLMELSKPKREPPEPEKTLVD